NFLIKNESDPSQEFFVVNGSTGKVGVGTANPKYDLDVGGGTILGSSISSVVTGDGETWSDSTNGWSEVTGSFTPRDEDSDGYLELDSNSNNDDIESNTNFADGWSQAEIGWSSAGGHGYVGFLTRYDSQSDHLVGIWRRL
ncbi:MAG: hypothetical protein ABEI52_10755, partial [Halobacteriaceae archaeon]